MIDLAIDQDEVLTCYAAEIRRAGLIRGSYPREGDGSVY